MNLVSFVIPAPGDQSMIWASVFAIASVGLLATCGFASACEMHGKDHTSLQAAATHSIAVPPPAIAPSPKPVALQIEPAPAEVKAMSPMGAQGGIGCPRMRKKQTVYYTD